MRGLAFPGCDQSTSPDAGQRAIDPGQRLLASQQRHALEDTRRDGRPAIATRTGWNTLPGLAPVALDHRAQRGLDVLERRTARPRRARRAPRAALSTPPSRPIVLSNALGSSTGPVEEERRPAARSRPASGSSPREISTAPRSPVRPVNCLQPRGQLVDRAARAGGGRSMWRSFCSSNTAGFLETRSSRKRSASSSQREVLLVGGEAGAEQRDVVVDRLGQVAGVAQLLDRRGAVALGELRAVGAVQQRQVRVPRRRRAQRLEHQQLLGRVGEVVLAAHDVRDAGVEVVDGDREVVERRAVGAGDHRVVHGWRWGSASRRGSRRRRPSRPSSGTRRRTAPDVLRLAAEAAVGAVALPCRRLTSSAVAVEW